jgi:hypothetical protein
MSDEELDQLIAADDLGLTTPRPKHTPQTSEEARLQTGFHELVHFVEAMGVAPVELGTGMNERMLFKRLIAIQRNSALCEPLRPFDDYGLLCGEVTGATMDDVLDDAFFDSLDYETPDIFTLKHIPLSKEIEAPDYVAQRKPCKDFAKFEPQFQDCQHELTAEKRRLLAFANEQQIEVGKFYVLRGILLLVSEVGERTEKNGKWNARLRCIFENGTESDMLLRSLAAELYKDGRRVTELDEKAMAAMQVTDDDTSAGFIYVLRSLSDHPDIKAVPHLYKIGLARSSIQTRIQNAANEPTYLMAPVALVSTFQCYNVHLPKLENLLHRFFDQARAKIQVTDSQGNYHTPQEWFSVPLETIEIALRLLISGEIVDFHYDTDSRKVLLNGESN